MASDEDAISGANVQIIHRDTPEAMTAYLVMWQNIVKSTPRDDFDYLAYFVDHTYIPDDFVQRSAQQQRDLIDAAKIPLTTTEGYLAFDFSKPVWDQLPHEPDAYWGAFRAYIQHPGRSLAEAERHMPTGFTPFTLREAYHVFYWSDRGRAYDLQRSVAAARLRDTRTLEVEDAHFQLARSLRSEINEELKKRADEQEGPLKGRPFAGMKVTDLFNAMISTLEVERVAIGLPARGPLLKPIGFVPEPGAGVERLTAAAIRTNDLKGDGATSPAAIMRDKLDKMFAKDPAKAAELERLAVELMLSAREEESDGGGDGSGGGDTK